MPNLIYTSDERFPRNRQYLTAIADALVPVKPIVYAARDGVQIHGYLAWTLLWVVVLHSAAALKHHFVDRDATLRRMLAWRGR